jgi:hypothetical protein
MVTIAGTGCRGCELITASVDAGDIHPEEFVTVKLCVPVANPEIVVLRVFPEIDPGLIVQVPTGKLFRITLPVAVAHVG